MSKPTPGPWHAGPTGPVMREKYSQPFGVGESGTVNLIAGVFGDVRGGEEVAEANACLIAAAPDLLAACELALKRIDPNPDDRIALEEWAAEACYALSAAIAKATGATP